MRHIIRLGALLALLALFGAVLPPVRDEAVWRWSAFGDEATHYERYLTSWPDGRHAEAARHRLEERRWSAAETEDSPAALQRYLSDYPAGASAQRAAERIEELHWAEAERTATIASYEAHAIAYPEGRFFGQARARQDTLRADERPFSRALGQGTREALEAFLADYPGHAHESDVREALRDIDGRDITDLARQGKIEVETEGSGIQTVRLKVRRLAAHAVTVRVPVGTFFVSRNSSTQNMVTTDPMEQTLTSGEWVTLSVPAACANRPKGIPRGSDSFTIRRSPQQAMLARLMPVISDSGAGYAVKQAAVWLVTDDASYSGLGILVRGYQRVIREAEAARAMQLFDQAGMDVTERAIWRDRQQILLGLQDGDLKRWLQSRQ
jgi:hypothetical protein